MTPGKTVKELLALFGLLVVMGAALVLSGCQKCVESHTETRHVPYHIETRIGNMQFQYGTYGHKMGNNLYMFHVPVQAHDEEVVVCDKYEDL